MIIRLPSDDKMVHLCGKLNQGPHVLEASTLCLSNWAANFSIKIEIKL